MYMKRGSGHEDQGPSSMGKVGPRSQEDCMCFNVQFAEVSPGCPWPSPRSWSEAVSSLNGFQPTGSGSLTVLLIARMRQDARSR